MKFRVRLLEQIERDVVIEAPDAEAAQYSALLFDEPELPADVIKISTTTRGVFAMDGKKLR